MAGVARLSPIDINLLYKRKTVRSLDFISIIIPSLILIMVIGGVASMYIGHDRLSDQIHENQMESSKVEQAIMARDSVLQEQFIMNPNIDRFIELPIQLGIHYYPPTTVIDSLSKLLPMQARLSDLSMKANLIGPQQGIIDIQFNGTFQTLADTELFIHAINQSKIFELDQVEMISKVTNEDGSTLYTLIMKLYYYE